MYFSAKPPPVRLFDLSNCPSGARQGGAIGVGLGSNKHFDIDGLYQFRCAEKTRTALRLKRSKEGRVGLIWVEDKHVAVKHVPVGNNTTVALTMPTPCRAVHLIFVQNASREHGQDSNRA